ncbi:MAG: SdrD B-like domain-containing protein [Balneolaceae bacterium]|nr:SdrD B-like domain-containing protein [Balneolaceae bacterium]
MNIRMRIPLLLLALTMTAYSCSDIQSPLSVESSPDLKISSGEAVIENDNREPIPLNNYLITFNGKSYDQANDQSTFSYTVNGTGTEPALNYLFIESPTCAGTPVAYSPVQSAKVNLDGITWESSIPTTGSQVYSITYSGDLPIGAVTATSESGNVTDSAEIPGPCQGIYTISGNVFVDGNSNGLKNSSESGIQNVTVHLNNGAGMEFSQKTLSNGTYAFQVFTGSGSVDFRIEVRQTTADTSDFNEGLFDGYNATTVTSKTVTVNEADQSGIDFGFAPQTAKLILQFEEGQILLDTEEPKFWIQQLRFAQKNNSNAEISAADLLGYLEVIEELFLIDPFQFGDNKIDAALDILTGPAKTELESLLVQLLAAELNVVSGRGSGNIDFDLALIAYGESAADELKNGTASLNTISSTSTSTTEVSAALKTSISDAESLLTSFNSSGGGGGVGNNN